MGLEALSFGKVTALVDPKGGEANGLWKAAWTELNFCRLFICLNLSMARSRRLNGWCEFSQRLLAQRPISCFSALPICFIAARRPSVVIAFGEPWRLSAFLMKVRAAALSLSLVTKLSSTSPSWSMARHR